MFPALFVGRSIEILDDWLPDEPKARPLIGDKNRKIKIKLAVTIGWNRREKSIKSPLTNRFYYEQGYAAQPVYPASGLVSAGTSVSLAFFWGGQEGLSWRLKFSNLRSITDVYGELVEKVFVGRQAIYKDGIKVFGYELLSRQSELNRAAFVDGDKATAELLLNTFINIGLEQVVGPSLAFVNVTRNFVLSNYYASLPKDRIVFEISDKAVDEPWLSALTRLSGAGYPIALDNFVYAEHLRPLIERSNIVKIDVQALNRDEITCQTEALRRFDVKLLAQKVETHDDYQFCKDLGFDYFQGYFFCKPQVLSEQKIPFNRLSSLHLLSKLQDPQITVDELELAVGQDVAVSYRILRYLNSPVNAMPRKIESLRHAISLVGTRLICNWASLILMEAIEEKPRELVINTMIRAYMCQQLGALKYQGNLDQFFTVGLLSLMDALLDKPFPNALESLPLAEEVKEALLYRKGLMGEALSCVQAYERCDWDHASFSKLDEGTIREAYLRSLAWTRNVIRELV